MSPNAAKLLQLAESIADGAAVDWETTESVAAGEDRRIVSQLRVLAQLAIVHRSVPVEAAETAAGPARGESETAPGIGIWGDLELIERLGQGTFGEVYRARDRALQRDVALKLLRTRTGFETRESSRLAREGQLLARVHHPNVITVHGVAVHDGRAGLWMELIRGATLAQILATRGQFSAREAALIGIDLCRALAAIHAAGLIHRDVKAQNVMREDGGRIVLMDLGIGREITVRLRDSVASAGQALRAGVAGTPVYVAPEIFSGAPASVSTDVYSLGVLMYHLVTNAYPVRGSSLGELRQAHDAGRRVRLRDVRADLPTAFVRVIDRSIAGPADRYGTPGDLEADLVQSLDDAAVPAPAGGSGAEAQPRRPISWRAAASVVGLVALVVAAVLWFGRGDPPPAAVTAASVRSIAVLPLANLSGDPSQDPFADGLTDELIATLGRIKDLTVISRTSVAQFKGTTRSLPDIARDLNVDAILEGSVQVEPIAGAPTGAAQPRVKINARLILAGTGKHLLNRTFERVRTDVLGLQSEVAGAIADEINRQLAPSQRNASAAQASTTGDSQTAYLEGRSYLGIVDREGMIKARQALERSVKVDPKFARAHAALSVCYVYLELMGVLSRAEAYEMAKRAGQQALDLDPNLPEAHGALADLQLLYDWDWKVAGESYQRALALNPSYTFARRQYAWYLAALGRGAESLQQARLAQDADPLSIDAQAVVAMMLYYSRDFDAAIAQMQRAIKLGPDRAQEHFGLARAFAGKGAYPDAIRELELAIKLSGGTPTYVAELARTHAVAGDAAKAREIFAQLEQTSKAAKSYISPLSHAFVQAALGDKDAAFRRLDEAVRLRTPTALWSNVDPRLDVVRDDPRFVEVVRRLGLPSTRRPLP